MSNLISIIVPVYNVEAYLGECIESIINQTYKNIEIILINDGSTDNSLSIMEEYQRKDKRIITINRENKGVLYTRAEGFKIAKGKYITFVDSDDWIEENLIEKLYNTSIKNNADVVKCAFVYNNSKDAQSKVKEEIYISKEKFEPNFYDKLFKEMNIHTVWAQLFKKDKLKDIDKIDNSISLGDDLEFNIQLYKNIDNIVFIPDALYHYRFNNSSITHKFSEENIKRNIDSVTKAYFNAYKVIDELGIQNKETYKSSVLGKLFDEVIKWQIDLIGTLKDKKKCIDYLNWYYNEKELLKTIKNECKDIGFDSNKLKYNIYYNKANKNINGAYNIGLITYKVKRIYRVLKKIKRI